MLQQERWDFVQKWKAREAGRADAAGMGATAEEDTSEDDEDEDEAAKRQIDSDDDF